MPVLATCYFNDEPIKNEGAIVSTAFSPLYKSMGKIFNAQGRVTPKSKVGSGRKWNSSEIFLPVLVTHKFEE